MVTGKRKKRSRRSTTAQDAVATFRQVPPRLLLIRVLLVAGAAALAYLSFASAVAGVARTRNATLATRLTPDDPIALAQLGYERLIADPRHPEPAQAEAFARRSLEELAINPRGLRVLGFALDVEGKQNAALRKVALAHRMTRRDLSAEMWLIEQNVRRDDVPGALEHYDHALRTDREVRDLLFPILTEAMTSSELWGPIARLIGSGSPWAPDFLSYAIENSRSPVSIAKVVERAGGVPPSSAYPPLESRLLQLLAQSSYGEEAARYYLSLPGAERRALQSLDFTAATTNAFRAPVAWQLFNFTSVSAGFEAADQARKLQLRVTIKPGQQAIAAQKLLTLAAGDYRLASTQQLSPWVDDAAAHWELECASEGKRLPIWRGAALSNGTTESPTPVRIPTGCKAQLLKLILNGGAGADQSELLVRSVAIRPIRS